MRGESLRNACCKRLILATLALVIAGAAHGQALLQLREADWQHAAQALDQQEHPIVRALPRQERDLLRATVALHMGKLEEALRWAEPYAENDPLAAVLVAETHRRQAIAAMREAGAYARPVEDRARLLAKADLSPGLAEAEARLARFLDLIDGVAGPPVDVLELGDLASVFLVDKARARLFVYASNEQGKFVRVADEYVALGLRDGDKQREGDGRTPSGVYRFIGMRKDPALAPRYGPVVFPIDYPNALDRLHGKDGHGIWLHGYPEGAKRRPPNDTRGCFSVPNDRLDHLARYIVPGKTWVVVGENLTFGDDARWHELRASVLAAIESWRLDWQSRNTEAYLRHYHPRFHSGRFDFKRWAAYKRRVNASKRYIRVRIENLILVHDPHPHPEGEVVVAEFTQYYDSSNYRDVTRKRIYWVREDADAPWRILIEEEVAPSPTTNARTASQT